MLHNIFVYLSMDFFELNNKVQSFVKSLPRTIDKIANDNASFAIKAVQNQLLDGETPQDTAITPSYSSDFYAKYKNTLNSRPTMGIPDLRVTGGYYAGIKLIGKYPKYELIGTNEKTPMLHEKYGDNLGLNKLNQQSFINKNMLDLQSEFKRAIQ